MSTTEKIALRALEGLAGGVLLFAVLLAAGADNPLLTYLPLGIGSLYFLAQAVRLNQTKR